MTKPITITTVSDSSRFFMNTHRLLRPGRAATPHTVLSEYCICANTVVAPTTSAPAPSSEGSSPDVWTRDCATARCTACAASVPISPRSWATISPCAATSPNTRPITVTAMMTTGASENNV